MLANKSGVSIIWKSLLGAIEDYKINERISVASNVQ